VAQGLSALPFTLISECQVVMSIGIARAERNGAGVRGDGLVGPLQFVEHVAEIEESEDIRGICLGGAAIELLGTA